MTRLLLILSFVEEFDKIVFLEIKLLHIVRKVCVLGIIVRVYTLVGVYIGIFIERKRNCMVKKEPSDLYDSSFYIVLNIFN
jgi:hypothetical protein